MDRYDMEADAKWGAVALLRPAGQWVHYLHAAEAIAAETARADREAAARQEAERALTELGGHYSRCVAERDRLRAELAALRGNGKT